MKYVKLKPNSKKPKANAEGHHDIVSEKPEGPYGISLDGEFVAIDFDKDHPQRESIEKSLPPTWSQRTGRTDAIGMHYLYSIPEGYTHKNSDIYTPDGTHIGEIKFKGYIAGPGTIVKDEPGKDLPYTRTNDLDPMPILPETLEPLYRHAKASKTHPTGVNEFDVMPDGQRDNDLHRLGSAMRSIGWTEKGIAINLAAIVNAGTVSQPEGREIEKKDIERLAHSVAKYDTEIQNPFTVKIWPSAYDLPDEQPMIEWIEYGFIPQNQLSLQYGKGAIGKSTWLPWLVRRLLKQGKRVGFSATEEPFYKFANGVRLGEKNFDKELLRNLFNIGNEWRFFKDEKKLKDHLEQNQLDFIYIDSIYDIFDPQIKGSSLAEKARPVLSPLVTLAEEMKVSIFSTFHETKKEDYNGPADMRNIPRVLLHATSENERLRLHIVKSNYKKPNYDILFRGEWIYVTNPNGTPLLETNREGIPEQSKMYVVTGYDDVEVSSDDKTVYNEEAINSSNDEEYQRVYRCKQENPTWGRIRIARELALSEKVVENRLAKIASALA